MKNFKLATLALFVSVCALTQICDAAQMALKLEGDPGSYFAAPDNDGLDKAIGSALTIEAWINPAITVEENGAEMMILNKEDSYEMADVTDTFQVALRPADVGSDTAGWEYWDSGVSIPVNTWTHVAATWDGTTIRTFINGKFAMSFEKLGPDGNKGTLSFENGSSGGKATLKVGRRGRGDDRHSIFNGLIDEVRISKVLRYTEAGFTVPTKAFEPDADTVALYHFDEASTAAADLQALKDKFGALGQTDDNGDGDLDPLTDVVGVVKDSSPLGNHGALTGPKATLVPVTNGPISDTP
jgi:Concanavalin A-like lectin/glucanases superfamily